MINIEPYCFSQTDFIAQCAAKHGFQLVLIQSIQFDVLQRVTIRQTLKVEPFKNFDRDSVL